MAPRWHDLGEDVEAARIGDEVIVRRISYPWRRIRIMTVDQWRAACPPELLFVSDNVNEREGA